MGWKLLGFFSRNQSSRTHNNGQSQSELLPITQRQSIAETSISIPSSVSSSISASLTSISGTKIPPNAEKAGLLSFQNEMDQCLQKVFGGYLVKDVNWVHEKLIRARLAFRSGSLEERYYAYCYHQKKGPYLQTLGLSTQEINDRIRDDYGRRENSRRLLSSVLPVNMPTDTADPVINQRNQKTNQVNGLLESRIREYIRQALKEYEAQGGDLEDFEKVYQQLRQDVLSQIQDPNVKWIERSDAGIVATILIEEERYVRQQSYHGSQEEQLPAVPARHSKHPIIVTLPTDAQGYLQPKALKSKSKQDADPVIYDSEISPPPDDDEKAVTYDIANSADHHTITDEQRQYDIATDRSWEEPPYTLGNAANEDDLDTNSIHSEHTYDQASSEDPSRQPRNSLGYMQIFPNKENSDGSSNSSKSSPKISSEEEVVYDDIDNPNAKKEASSVISVPLAKRSLPAAPMRRQSTVPMVQPGEMEKPIPPNPFSEEVLPEALYKDLVRDIRKVIINELHQKNSTKQEETLGDIVRRLIKQLNLGKKSNYELHAVRIVVQLAEQEIAVPGFNYLQGLLSDQEYQVLFETLSKTVSAFRNHAAAPVGSVPAQPNQKALNDNMALIKPVLSAYIKLYVKQLSISARKNLPFQVALLLPQGENRKIENHFYLVIKQGVIKQENQTETKGFTTECYEVSNSQGNIIFKKIDKVFTSYHKFLNSKEESFGHDPKSYYYCDEESNVYKIAAAANAKANTYLKLSKDREQMAKRLETAVLINEILDKMSDSAIQYAYNRQKEYTWSEQAKRWIQMHPKTMSVIGGSVVVGAAAGGAYAAGLFNAPPCSGYMDGEGSCVDAEIPSPECQFNVLTSGVSEGGVAQFQVICPQASAVSASSSQQSYQVTNIPLGASVSINGDSIPVSDGVITLNQAHLGHTVRVQLPNGFSGSWAPRLQANISSGSKTYTGTVVSQTPVSIVPIAGIATVVNTGGSFSCAEGGNTTFRMRWNPAPGDADTLKLVRNLPIGHRLCGRNAQGQDVCFESTLENKGNGTLPFTGLDTEITYVPSQYDSGSFSFDLIAKSVDGTAVGAESAPFRVTTQVQGIAEVPLNVTAPNIIYTVEGQVSQPFNLSAMVRAGDALEKAVVLPAGSRLCGRLRSNGAADCVENTGDTPQEFDISTWQDQVIYQGGEDFIFKTRGTVGSSHSVWRETPVIIDQLNAPTVTFTQNNSSMPVSQLTFNEDTSVEFNLNVDYQNADKANVILEFPEITSAFSGGTYQVGGTLANGFNVTASVNPGESLDVSGWRLDLPMNILPPANVNRGNQGGDLNVNVRVSAQTEDGRSVAVNQVLPLSVRPVADPFTFTGRGAVTVTAGGGTTLFGPCQTSVHGEFFSPYIRVTAPPVGTFFERVEPVENTNQFPRVVDNGDGTYDVGVPNWIGFGFRWRVPMNASAPQERLVSAIATVNDGESQLSQKVELNLRVNPRPS